MSGRTNVTMPYRILRPGDVHASPCDGWMLRFADNEGQARLVGDGDVVESWDYLRPFTLSRTLRFAAEVPELLGLPRDTTFRLLVLLTTGRGLHRRLVHSEDFGIPHEPLNVAIQLDSRRLCRDLTLAALLSLASPVASSDPIVPAEPGARLWEHTVKLELEGGRSRLPMEVVSFRHAFAGQGFEQALVHVEMVPYPELDLEDAVLVYLNADFPAFVDAVQQTEPTAEAMLWEAVLQRLLRDALLDEAFFANPSYAPGSLGANLARWIQQAFPSMPLSEVAQLLTRDSSRFDATIQSWALISARLYRREGA